MTFQITVEINLQRVFLITFKVTLELPFKLTFKVTFRISITITVAITEAKCTTIGPIALKGNQITSVTAKTRPHAKFRKNML